MLWNLPGARKKSQRPSYPEILFTPLPVLICWSEFGQILAETVSVCVWAVGPTLIEFLSKQEATAINYFVCPFVRPSVSMSVCMNICPIRQLDGRLSPLGAFVCVYVPYSGKQPSST